jgi:hypothetical protein
MQEIFDEMKHVDGNCQWVDLRFDSVYVPSIGSPQTANAQIGQ